MIPVDSCRSGADVLGSGRCSPAHLWRRAHAATVHVRIALRAARAAAALPVAGLTLAGVVRTEPAAAADGGWKADEAALANAADPSPDPLPLAPFDALRAASVLVDLELRTGVGWTTLSEDGLALNDYISGCADATLRVGGFANSHLKWGYEATGGARRVLGDRDAHEVLGYSQPEAPIEGDTWYFLPLGGFIELYPWARAGASLGLHAGVGTFWPPQYMVGGNIELAGTIAADVGYEHVWSTRASWGLRLRLAATGFGQSYIDENYSTTQTSKELTLAARVSLF
jgi:hypothetical protein